MLVRLAAAVCVVWAFYLYAYADVVPGACLAVAALLLSCIAASRVDDLRISRINNTEEEED